MTPLFLLGSGQLRKFPIKLKYHNSILPPLPPYFSCFRRLSLVLHKPHHDTLKVSKLSSHYDQFCNELSANHLQTFFFFHGHPHPFNSQLGFRVIQINFHTVNCRLILNYVITIVQSHNSLLRYPNCPLVSCH